MDAVREAAWLVRLKARLDEHPLDPTIRDELGDIAREQAGRPRMGVTRSRSDLHALQAENAWCLGTRNRVSEIATMYGSIRIALDDLWDAAEARIQQEPSYWTLPNERARVLVVRAVLGALVARRREVSKVLKACKQLRASLTHHHFAVKQHAELGLALLVERSA